MQPLSIARKVVKTIAVVVGGLVTLVCLMATIGLVTGSGWVRAPLALLALVAVPAVLTDRLLPDVEDKPKGLASDIFALFYLGSAVLYVVVAHGYTRNMLATEGDRLAAADMGALAWVSYTLAGAEATGAAQADPAGASVSSSSASLSVSGAPASASASASASTSTSASASASASTSPSAGASASARGSASAAEPEPEAAAGDMSAGDIFKKYAPAVVTIQLKDGGGTGFLLNDKGVIATNEHVVGGADEEVAIVFKNGAVFKTAIWILDLDSVDDLALLQVDLSKPDEGEAPDVVTVELGDSDEVEVGEPAISIGNPLGLEHTLTSGIVSQRRTYRGQNWIQMSTPVSPGNSGGPVFNRKGEVIGVTTRTVGGPYGGAQNLNLAVPVNVLKLRVKPTYPGKRKFGEGAPKTW